MPSRAPPWAVTRRAPQVQRTAEHFRPAFLRPFPPFAKAAAPPTGKAQGLPSIVLETSVKKTGRTAGNRLRSAAARFLPLCLRGERKTKPAEAGGGSATLGTRQHRSLFCRDAALKQECE